ncbi:MAG: GNAT family N-acetyltransferase [Actinomycetota bacterium]
MLIRDAKLDELDETANVMVEAYSQYAKDLSAVAYREYSEEIADVKRRLPFSDLIVGEHEGGIVGAVTFYADASLSEHEGWPPDYSEIRLLAVSPKGRGLGMGRALTNECILRAKANGSAAIGLHTSYLMSVARDLYERMGFARVPEYDFRPREDTDIIATAYLLKL